MTKGDVVKDIKKEYGSFVNLSNVAEYLRCGRDSARALVDGLDYYNSGRAKLYFAGDVADRIMQQRGI